MNIGDQIVYGYTQHEIDEILERADPDEIEKLVAACRPAPSAESGLFLIAIGAVDRGLEILTDANGKL